MSGGKHVRRSAAVAMAMLLGWSGVTLLAPAAQAVPVGDAQIVASEAFLTNGFVEVGSRANGTFGSNNPAPAGYHPRDGGGRVGFRADRDQDGWGVGIDDGDFFTPGSPYEGWGVQVGNGSTTRWNTNSATAIPGAYSSPTLTGLSAEATWGSTAPVDGLSVTQVVSVPAGQMYLGMNVTLTNTTGSPMSDVYYIRALDPDNCKTVTTVSCDSDGDGVADSVGVYETRNRILDQVRDGDPLSVVSATQTDGSYLDLRSSETGSLAATATVGGYFCTRISPIDPFYTAPLTLVQGASNCPLTTTRGADNFEDDLIYQVVKTPTLGAGASRTINLKYFLSAAAAAGSTPQTITFAQPGTAELSQNTVTLTATSDAGLPVAYISSTPATCSVSGTTLTLLATGTCTIDATQTGDAVHAPASTVTRSFAIVPTPTTPSPVPPPVADLTSTGVGTAAQHVTVPVPAGASAFLVDDSGQLSTTVNVSGVGVYTLEPTTGVITFTPAEAYSGTPSGVRYRVRTAQNASAEARYTPTVTKPAAPAPAALSSRGPRTQHATVKFQNGETVTLLDSAGNPTGSAVTIVGEGTYNLDPATGIITFAPEPGFTGTGTGVGFRVTDAYGQHGLAAYVPTIGAIVTPTPTPAPEPTPTPAPKPLPKIDRKALAKIPANPRAVTGKERKTRAYNSSFTGVDANPIVKLGARQLATGQATTLSGDGLFDFDSAKLTKKGRAQVKTVVKNLKGTQAVTCEGYTDYAGSRDHELDLSSARAKAVCTTLKMYGAKVTTRTTGYGPQRPVVVGGTAKGRRENRRVVILVTR